MRNDFNDELARNAKQARKQLGLLEKLVGELRNLQRARGIRNMPAAWRITTLPRRTKYWAKFTKLGRLASHALPVADILFDFCVEYLKDDLARDVDYVLEAEDNVNGALADLLDAVADAEQLLAADGSSSLASGNHKRAAADRLENTHRQLISEVANSGDAYENVNRRVRELESLGGWLAKLDTSVNRGAIAGQIKEVRAALAGLPDTSVWKGSMQ